MIVYRLTKPEYADDLSGFGASLVGGRWNKPGEFVLYTAQTASLSILETLVHLNGATLGVRFDLLKLEIDNPDIHVIHDLPEGWQDDDGLNFTREIGGNWLHERKATVLEVPSVLNPLEKNYLVNSLHPKCKIRTVERKWYFYDGRLIKQG